MAGMSAGSGTGGISAGSSTGGMSLGSWTSGMSFGSCTFGTSLGNGTGGMSLGRGKGGMPGGIGRVVKGFSGAASWFDWAAQPIVMVRVTSAALSTAMHCLAGRFGGGTLLRRDAHSDSVLT